MEWIPSLGGMRGGLVLVAPSGANLAPFQRLYRSAERHRALLDALQRLRGALYVQDGAVRPEDLTQDGRHDLPIDQNAWHLIGVTGEGEVYACARYNQYRDAYSSSDLAVSNCALARSARWGSQVRQAVEREVALARAKQFSFVELGGWAIHPEMRCTSDALRMALATYALWRKCGGAVGLATVTHRHSAASILRRLGGSPLATPDGAVLPDYFDPQYGCQMQILRFSSENCNPRFEFWVDRLEKELATIPVIADESSDVLHHHRAGIHSAKHPIYAGPAIDSSGFSCP